MPTILPALPAHGPGAQAVAEAVRFTFSTARSADGYLVYIPGPEEYARRFAADSHSVVALDGDRVVGFLRAIPGLHPELDPASVQLAAHLPLDGFVLIEQIGLLPAYKGRGLAQAMLDAVIASSGANRLGAVIMHGPVRNARSLGFFTGRNGFSLVHELADPDFEWGYYEKRLGVVS